MGVIINNSKSRRWRTTIRERRMPCACCDYPIIHRHHVIGFAQSGESGTRFSCARTATSYFTSFSPLSSVAGIHGHEASRKRAYYLMKHPNFRGHERRLAGHAHRNSTCRLRYFESGFRHVRLEGCTRRRNSIADFSPISSNATPAS